MPWTILHYLDAEPAKQAIA